MKNVVVHRNKSRLGFWNLTPIYTILVIHLWGGFDGEIHLDYSEKSTFLTQGSNISRQNMGNNMSVERHFQLYLNNIVYIVGLAIDAS